MGFLEEQTDIRMSLEGDLVLDGNGDFEVTTGLDWLSREINKRLRTSNPEWYAHPGIGVDVAGFVGMANTRYTARKLKESVESALQDPALIGAGRLSVEVIPISGSEVRIYISVVSGDVATEVAVLLLDFNGGLVFTQEDDIPAEPVTEPIKTFSRNQYLERIRRPR